jgi:hypothetical protein
MIVDQRTWSRGLEPPGDLAGACDARCMVVVSLCGRLGGARVVKEEGQVEGQAARLGASGRGSVPELLGAGRHGRCRTAVLGRAAEHDAASGEGVCEAAVDRHAEVRDQGAELWRCDGGRACPAARGGGDGGGAAVLKGDASAVAAELGVRREAGAGLLRRRIKLVQHGDAEAVGGRPWRVNRTALARVE